MELSKHKAHRNPAYLNWLRKQNCVVSGKKAQCAHHIRLGTNGGTGLKPSDYFCIPLTNEFHTTGPEALHIIGEETFLREFKLNPIELFVGYLTDYLAQRFEVLVARDSKPAKQALLDLITIIETESLKYKKQEKPKPKPKPKPTPKKDPKYEKAKKLKNERDKDLRQKLKVPSKDNEFYQIAKNVKRERERVLREKMKDNQSEALEKAKEANKVRQKEFRKKLAKKKKAKAKRSGK